MPRRDEFARVPVTMGKGNDPAHRSRDVRRCGGVGEIQAADVGAMQLRVPDGWSPITTRAQ
jgi:hypothetical protein